MRHELVAQPSPAQAGESPARRPGRVAEPPEDEVIVTGTGDPAFEPAGGLDAADDAGVVCERKSAGCVGGHLGRPTSHWRTLPCIQSAGLVDRKRVVLGQSAGEQHRELRAAARVAVDSAMGERVRPHGERVEAVL